MGNIQTKEIPLENLPAKVVKYPKGAVVFKNGEFTRDLYIIKSGRVRIFKMLGVRIVSLTELGKGSVFGEVAAIDGGVRSATVQALEDSEIFVMGPQEFNQKIQNLPEWFSKISRILVSRPRETDHRIEMENAGNSEYNFVLLLSYFAACEGKDEEGGAKSLDLQKTENELIDLTRIRFKDISDILDRLKKKDLIDIRKDRLVILKPDALEQYGKTLVDETGNLISL